MNDPHDLGRFIEAQEPCYAQALDELRHGRKQTHWMWFVFPQLLGLGHSAMARRYAIVSSDEARRYLAHPLLGKRLRECAETVLEVEGRSAREIMGSPDDLKLRSSMTLFDAVSGSESLFARVLEKFYSGQADPGTLDLLARAPQD